MHYYAVIRKNQRKYSFYGHSSNSVFHIPLRNKIMRKQFKRSLLSHMALANLNCTYDKPRFCYQQISSDVVYYEQSSAGQV